MHLSTTQILLLATSSLLALTSAGPLPTTLVTAISTSTPSPVPIVEKRLLLEDANVYDANGHPEYYSPEVAAEAVKPHDEMSVEEIENEG